MSTATGKLIILSAPSGTVKSTAVASLCALMPQLQVSVSCTTRPKRPQEQDGKDYFFLTEAEFRARMAAGDFAEWAQVHGNFYGTPKAPLEEVLGSSRVMLLDLDVQGGMQLKKAFPQAVSIFLLPPSFEVLQERLQGRATDSPEQIRLRLENAKRELEYQNFYDYCVVNDDLEQAVRDIAKIIRKVSPSYGAH